MDNLLDRVIYALTALVMLLTVYYLATDPGKNVKTAHPTVSQTSIVQESESYEISQESEEYTSEEVMKKPGKRTRASRPFATYRPKTDEY